MGDAAVVLDDGPVIVAGPCWDFVPRAPGALTAFIGSARFLPRRPRTPAGSPSWWRPMFLVVGRALTVVPARTADLLDDADARRRRPSKIVSRAFWTRGLVREQRRRLEAWTKLVVERPRRRSFSYSPGVWPRSGSRWSPCCSLTSILSLPCGQGSCRRPIFIRISASFVACAFLGAIGLHQIKVLVQGRNPVFGSGLAQRP
jgi:hypothetical protein